jgi:hypothetical protein
VNDPFLTFSQRVMMRVIRDRFRLLAAAAPFVRRVVGVAEYAVPHVGPVESTKLGVARSRSAAGVTL